MSIETNGFRRTTQHLMPLEAEPPPEPVYDIYPAHDVEDGLILAGFDQLARLLARHQSIVIDGYVGIDWEDFRERLDAALKDVRVEARWSPVSTALKSADDIRRMITPYLGGDDPLFGTRFLGALSDFFDMESLAKMKPKAESAPQILYGCGAALSDWDGFLVYVDLPKNELQFRSRAGGVRNLGAANPEPPKVQYKRFYFVDWPVLNRHKEQILSRVDLIVDGQRPAEPAFMAADAWREGLQKLAHSSFRVRPWFEPGPWGGQWIREKIPGLSPDVPNYAWSFEMIVPENGLVFRSSRRMLEFSFDWLMFAAHTAVIGESASRFGFDFPIRFDFLDTMDGGNLSLQCHPRPEYIARHFGETFTQDETYYILDCDPGAVVYLGFREGVDPDEFHRELLESHEDAIPFDADRHVQILPAAKHDFFLIPNGTIHCSGTGNMVLEISATPYIFTFKMYDWMRLDLDGKPRPLNIDRAMENLDFERQGERVTRELVSRPQILREEPQGRLVHLPTHPDHFYDVHRFEFAGAMEEKTQGSAHVMSLVEGRSVILKTPDGTTRRFHYAETFCVPAAAGSYQLLTEDDRPVMVVKAFVKSQGTV